MTPALIKNYPSAGVVPLNSSTLGMRCAAIAALVALVAAACGAATAPNCVGEFSLCPDGSCVLVDADCGKCPSGHYLCPDRVACVETAAEWGGCPGVRGTHFDTSLSIEERVEVIISQLNLTEKASLLTNESPAVERLSIPQYNWCNDDVHSVQAVHATVFPDGCGLGATWSREALEVVGRTVATEARATHNAMSLEDKRLTSGGGVSLYSPNMNLVRDPRWGRNQEVYSEDPFLTGSLVVALVGGIQHTEENVMLAAACCKHFAAYDVESIPTHRFQFDAEVTQRDMWETYLPAFDMCVRKGNVAHIMCSYNAIEGVPACADGDLLNGVLRDKWNFTGFVVSDYDAVAMLKDKQKFTQTYEQSIAAALNAGLDQEGGGVLGVNALPAAVADGLVTVATVDEALRRVLRVRLQLGLLSPPASSPWSALGMSEVEGQKHLQLAMEVAQQSMCLYKNADGVLPLSTSSVKKLAVIGPSATDTWTLLGNYARYPDRGISTILSGLREYLGDNTTGVCRTSADVAFQGVAKKTYVAEDAGHCCQTCSDVEWCRSWSWATGECKLFELHLGSKAAPGAVSGAITTRDLRHVAYASGCDTVKCELSFLFEDARKAVNGADAVVLVLGLDTTVEAEGHDRKSIALPGHQQRLLDAVRSGNPAAKLITVLVHGGTIDVQDVMDKSDAVIDAWYPGQMGGRALANVIFGHYNPAGRATATFYRSDSDLPPPGFMGLYPSNGTKGVTCTPPECPETDLSADRYFEGTPVIPFGHGLSYTQFAYSNLTLSASQIHACDTLTVSVQVANVGGRDGDEVVQCYVSQVEAKSPAPRVRLAGFERVHVRAGETVSVTVEVEPQWHSVVRSGGSTVYDGRLFVESGSVEVFVGGGQPAYFAAGLKSSVMVTDSSYVEEC